MSDRPDIPWPLSVARIGICRQGVDVGVGPVPPEQCAVLGDVFAGIDPWANYGIPGQSLCGYLRAAEPGAPRYAIVVGGQVAGVVGLRLNWLRGPYLQFLAIVPEFQRRGVGGLVLDWLEAEGRVRECLNLWVLVSRINPDAKTFYEAKGFKEAAEIRDLVVEGRDEILLRKRLLSMHA